MSFADLLRAALDAADHVAALNLARRAAETPRTGRAWARVLRSERRLFKRMAPKMGRGLVIGGILGTT